MEICCWWPFTGHIWLIWKNGYSKYYCSNKTHPDGVNLANITIPSLTGWVCCSYNAKNVAGPPQIFTLKVHPLMTNIHFTLYQFQSSAVTNQSCCKFCNQMASWQMSIVKQTHPDGYLATVGHQIGVLMGFFHSKLHRNKTHLCLKCICICYKPILSHEFYVR